VKLPSAYALSFATLLLGPAVSHAVVTFDNGPSDVFTNGVFTSNTAFAGFDFAAADDFTFAQDVTLRSMRFFTFEPQPTTAAPGVWDGTLKYTIWLDGGDTPHNAAPAFDTWGNATLVSKTDIGDNIFNSPAGVVYDHWEYEVEFEGMGVEITADMHYWIAMYLGTPDGALPPGANAFLFAQTTQPLGIGWPAGITDRVPSNLQNAAAVPGAPPMWFNPASDDNLAFQLTGVPTPAVIWLLATGLLALPLVRRRRRET
jgi:hypothetical protein